MLSLQEIKERLQPIFENPSLQLVLVFGSLVSGKTHKHSDIDLAFLFDEDIDILALTNQAIRLLKEDKMDVVDLRKANPLLKFSAVKTGRLIYEKSPGLYFQFYSLAFRMYADSKKLRDAQEVYIKNYVEAQNSS